MLLGYYNYCLEKSKWVSNINSYAADKTIFSHFTFRTIMWQFLILFYWWKCSRLSTWETCRGSCSQEAVDWKHLDPLTFTGYLIQGSSSNLTPFYCGNMYAIKLHQSSVSLSITWGFCDIFCLMQRTMGNWLYCAI